MEKEEIIISTLKQKYNYSKELFNLKTEKRRIEKRENEIQPPLVQYVERTGDKEFSWKNCHLTFVSSVPSKVVVDNKKLVESIEIILAVKGMLTKEDYERLKKEAEKENKGKTGYFRL